MYCCEQAVLALKESCRFPHLKTTCDAANKQTHGFPVAPSSRWTLLQIYVNVTLTAKPLANISYKYV